MKRHKMIVATLLLTVVLSAAACAAKEQQNDGADADQEAEQMISEEEQKRLLRRIDYALLGHGPYAGRALRGYLIADADNDGVEELFVDCGREADRETLFAFDFQEDGTPFGLCHANRSATGGSAFQIKDDGTPVLVSSFASVGVGTSEEYSRWNGNGWENFTASHAAYDFDAMKYTSGPVYLSEEATYEGEELTLEAFDDRIKVLNLQPFSDELSDLFAVKWPDKDLVAFAHTYDDHLAQLACDRILRVAGDIDQDGETEALWCIEGASFLWNQNMEYQDSYASTPGEDVFFFSGSRGADLVMADPGENGILIYTARFGTGLTEDLEFEDGVLTFTYSEGKSTRFQYDGVHKETGMFELKESVPSEEEYLREGVWYEFNPHDEFVNIYHFSDFYNGYTTQRRTDTGEESNNGQSFRYTVSENGNRVTIQRNDGSEDSYTYYADSGYGAALASEITYDIMPDGNQVPLQRIIWKYDSPPTAKQLAQDARSRRTIQIPESAALVKKSGLEQIIPPTGMAEDNISPWMGRMFCALRIMEIPLLTVR